MKNFQGSESGLQKNPGAKAFIWAPFDMNKGFAPVFICNPDSDTFQSRPQFIETESAFGTGIQIGIWIPSNKRSLTKSNFTID